MKKNRRKGSAIVEAALMMPWIFLLFAGVFDFGFYSYAAIAVENAARIGALYASQSGAPTDTTGACGYVLRELRFLPNVGGIVGTSTCAASPVVVTAQAATIDGKPATKVSVTYNSINVFPLPLLPGQYNVTRSVWMRQ